jgi:membrane-associated phospholipid phosphatase
MRARRRSASASSDPGLRLAARLRRPWLTPAVAGFSRLGDYGWGWSATALATGIAVDRVRDGATVAALVPVTLALNYGVKQVACRPRPAQPGLIDAPASSSFPSSHAAMSGAAACGLWWLAPELAPVWAVLALTMCGSRLYLGVHHTADVVAGAGLGLLVGAGAVALLA